MTLGADGKRVLLYTGGVKSWSVVSALQEVGMVITGIFFRYVFYYHIANGDIRMGASYYGTYCNSINLVNLFIGMVAMAWVTDRIGKKSALLLVADRTGDVRFVALALN